MDCNLYIIYKLNIPELSNRNFELAVLSFDGRKFPEKGKREPIRSYVYRV